MTEKKEVFASSSKKFVAVVTIAIVTFAFAACGSDNSKIPDNEIKVKRCNDGKVGYSHNGKEIIKCKFDDAESFRDGFGKVKLNGKFGLIDKNGKEITPIIYEQISPFKEGENLARVQAGRKWGFIDRTGKEVIPTKFEDFGLGGFKDGLIPAQLNGKWGFIDQAGKEVIPFKYDNANHFSEGLAGVYLDGKGGYIDPSGKVVIPFEYGMVSDFENGRAMVGLGRGYVYLDKNGNQIGKP